MPNNLPYMQFYVNDFDNDTCGLSSAAVGVWVRLLIAMHRKRCGELSGTIDYLAKITRCSAEELGAALREFEAENVCDPKRDGNGDVTGEKRDGNATVTVICRRLKREEIKRANTSERVKKFREKQAASRQDDDNGNADETLHARAYIQSQSQNHSPPIPPSFKKGGESVCFPVLDAVEALYAIFPRKGNTLSGKAAIRAALIEECEGKTPEECKTIIEKIKRKIVEYTNSTAAPDKMRFRQQADRWFHDRRYLDDFGPVDAMPPLVEPDYTKAKGLLPKND